MNEDTTPAGVCYRHPGRESWVLCQRCGRTICPGCQTQAAVGVHCPDCVAEARAAAKRPLTTRAARSLRARPGVPLVTYSLVAVTVAVYLVQLVTAGLVTQAGVLVPALVPREPWRMLTSVFLHAPLANGMFAILHIAFNMYILLLLGRTLEPSLGRIRFLALYLIAGFAGSVGVLWLSGPLSGALGASGAVFGLFGAYFVILRHIGRSATQIVVIVVLNFALGFFVGGISWQAHLGGLLGGALVALVYTRTRGARRRTAQIGLVATVVLGLVVLTAIRLAIIFG